MAEQENKKIIEREYIVPLRREWQKVPRYRRAKKAIKALKEFIARHMKIYDRDLRKVKLDMYLNNEIWFRGIKKPANKIKVKAIKYDNGIVEVKLVELPKHIEFELARKVRKDAEKIKPETKKSVEEQTEKQDDKALKDEKEKKESSKEAMEKIEKSEAKQAEHSTGIKKEPQIQRKSLRK